MQIGGTLVDFFWLREIFQKVEMGLTMNASFSMLEFQLSFPGNFSWKIVCIHEKIKPLSQIMFPRLSLEPCHNEAHTCENFR